MVYVVFRGRKPGIYYSWKECKDQIDGLELNEPCQHTRYSSRSQAQAAWDAWNLAKATDSEKSGTSDYGPISRALDSPSLQRESFKSAVPYIDLTISDDEEDFGRPPAKRQKSAADSFSSNADPGFNSNADVGFSSSPDFNSSRNVNYISPKVENSNGEETSIILTPAQQIVVDLALEGHNIFLTGAAGSGKTATLKEIQRRLKYKFPEKNQKYPHVQVVAPTGIAALPLNGKTTYSFAGWNPDSFQKPLDQILDRVQKYVNEAMHILKVLIVEEISMVENQFLERLNLLMQHVLESARPFGGKQVILLGDFHQIPPVKPFQFCIDCGEQMKKPEIAPVCPSSSCKRRDISFKPGDKWAFKAPVWEELKLKHVKLEQIHRQKDSRFQDVLNKIRNGVSLTTEEWNALTAKKNLPTRAFPVRLMSLKRRVEDFNGRQLSSITSKPAHWEALDTAAKFKYNEGDSFRANDIDRAISMHRENLKTYHPFPTRLVLKVGAKVVLLKNLSHETGLVNGSQGEVIGFVDTKDWQGSETLEAQKRQSQAQLRIEEAITEFQQLRGCQCPIVRFTNGATKTILPVAQESLKGTSQDKYRVCRTQIPLALAWALSIHKSQGMTLEYVELLSEDIFESGQLYVGMSRATTLAGLTVTGYSRNLMAVDEDVLKFYKYAKWEDLGRQIQQELVSNKYELSSPAYERNGV